MNGTPVVDSDTYLAAANDYLVSEAIRYLGITVTDQTYTNLTLYKTVEEKMRHDKTIKDAIDERIVEVK